MGWQFVATIMEMGTRQLDMWGWGVEVGGGGGGVDGDRNAVSIEGVIYIIQPLFIYTTQIV